MEPLRVMTAGSRSGQTVPVLTVALGKKVACNPQNMGTIIPDRERAEPSLQSRPLRLWPSGDICREMPPAGRFPEEKRGKLNRTIYLLKNRST